MLGPFAASLFSASLVIAATSLRHRCQEGRFPRVFLWFSDRHREVRRYSSTIHAVENAKLHTVPNNWETASFIELPGPKVYEIMRLRQQVFVVEQDCLYCDMDGLDPQALHLSAWRHDTVLAYLRALPPGVSYPESALGRIVVAPAARGQDLGRELVRRGIELSLATWPGAGLCLSGQAHLVPFYASLGFETASDVYDEDGIPHIKMRLRLET